MCLPWAACPRGREDTMGYLGATPPAPSPGLGYNQDPQSGCLGALVLASLVLASRAMSVFLGRLSSAPLQSRGSAQHSEELFAVRHVPNISERIKKGGNQGSIQLAASVLAHHSSHRSQREVVLSSQAMLGTRSPSVSPPLTPFSPTAPRAPGTPSPTTDGMTSRTPGTAHVAPPAAPPVPARRRAGLPRPPPSPSPPLPTAPGTLSSGGRPGQPVFLLRGVGGTRSASPPAPAMGGAARPARWLHPPPSHLLSVLGGRVGCSGTRDLFLSACWLLVL